MCSSIETCILQRETPTLEKAFSDMIRRPTKCGAYFKVSIFRHVLMQRKLSFGCVRMSRKIAYGRDFGFAEGAV